MENTKKGNGLVILLGVLLALAVVYAIFSNKQHNDVETELTTEKTNIQVQLNKMIADYDAKIAEGTSLKGKLTAARQDIITYRDSLLNVKQSSVADIRNFKLRIASIESKNKGLFAQLETLKKENAKLTNDIVEAKTVIETKVKENVTLANQNKVLVEKVLVGGALNINNLAVVGMKKQSDGALEETDRYKRVDAFRIQYKIFKNELTVAGNKKAYFVIKDPEGKVLSPKGTTTVAGNSINYSDETDIDYQNEEIEVIVVTDVDSKKLTKGEYTIETYLAGRKVGATKVELKPAFLGVF